MLASKLAFCFASRRCCDDLLCIDTIVDLCTEEQLKGE